MAAKRSAVVVGGSRGIGYACVKRLIRDGWKTVALSRNEANLIRAQRLVGSDLFHYRTCDITDEAAVNTAIEDVETTVGPIHVLINSAGIVANKLLVQQSVDNIQVVTNTNLLGTIWTSRAALKFMLRRKSGCIVNLGSVVGRHGNAGQVVYAATKAALSGFTKALAKEVASRNIRVNMVSPGFIVTDMTDGLDTTRLAPFIPLGRLGYADEVANVVVFLATSGSYITGQDVTVCGGLDTLM